jgi:hypothetical protein
VKRFWASIGRTNAKQAYLDLFAGTVRWLTSCSHPCGGWLDTQKKSASVDATALSDLDKWIQERSAIAGQTAALTREGTAAAWK